MYDHRPGGRGEIVVLYHPRCRRRCIETRISGNGICNVYQWRSGRVAHGLNPCRSSSSATIRQSSGSPQCDGIYDSSNVPLMRKRIPCSLNDSAEFESSRLESSRARDPITYDHAVLPLNCLFIARFFLYTCPCARLEFSRYHLFFTELRFSDCRLVSFSSLLESIESGAVVMFMASSTL